MSKLRIGASRIGVICGEDKNGSRHKEWRIKTGREERPPANAWMLAGSELEINAIAAVERQLGTFYDRTGEDQIEYREDRGCYQLVMYPDGVNHEGILEVKYKSNSLDEEIPLKHQMQLCVGLHLSGEDEAIYAQWQPGKLRIWDCIQNDDLLTLILEKTDAFADLVARDIEPPGRIKRVKNWPQLTMEIIHE